MKTLTKEAILKVYPELTDFSSNGKDDFNTVANVLGTRNPKQVWAVVNALTKSSTVAPRAQAKLNKLFG